MVGGNIICYSTLLEKRVPKGFFGCPHMRTLFGSRQIPFRIHVEPSVERVRHGTLKGSIWNQKGSTWNQKVFFKGYSYRDSRRTRLDSRQDLFSESVSTLVKRVYKYCFQRNVIYSLVSGNVTCQIQLKGHVLWLSGISLKCTDLNSTSCHSNSNSTSCGVCPIKFEFQLMS